MLYLRARGGVGGADLRGPGHASGSSTASPPGNRGPRKQKGGVRVKGSGEREGVAGEKNLEAGAE